MTSFSTCTAPTIALENVNSKIQNGSSSPEPTAVHEKDVNQENYDATSKSRITHTTFASFNSNGDVQVEQIEKDHYLYRRGSAAVHLQTYAASSAGGNDGRALFDGIKLASALIGLIMLVISTAIRMSAAITDKVVIGVVDQYILTLYIFGTLWFTYYILRGILRNKDEVKFLKSNQKSNRWLKGVVVLFGLAIVIKNGINFTALLMTNLTICSENKIKIAIETFQAAFVLAQTKYIFKFSKVYIKNCNTGSRAGLMMVISINLSTWIFGIIDETIHALHQESDHEGSTISYNNATSNHKVEQFDSSTDSCNCSSSFCAVADIAQTFLFPFLIEFSLVASCLLYVTWNNVGKRPPPCERVIKPSYKFYKSYSGSSFGSVIFFLTVIFLILLATTSSNTKEIDRDYFSENSQLIFYDCFLGGTELVMMTATCFGFYLFYRIRRPLEESSLLDEVLLVVCVVGPLAYNAFALIAVITGPENRSTLWIFTMFNPLIDALQCVLQLVFILYGLRREPIISSSSKDMSCQLKDWIKEQLKRPNNLEDQISEMAFDNKLYLRYHRSSITSEVAKIANASNQPESTILRPPNTRSVHINPPDIVVSPQMNESEKNDFDHQTDFNDTISLETDKYRQDILKIVSEIRVARPDKMRLWLRDVIMFLLLGNACLWLFYSLSGTAFTVYQYQSLFYGESAWTTITMISRPLTIFYRMHSAGCLFEMWSFG